jgi:hypothetical protein
VSTYTFLLIAHGGDGIVAEAWPMKDGGFMPVIVKTFGCERHRLLISWDDLRLPEDKALAHATACIEAVRREAKQQPGVWA